LQARVFGSTVEISPFHSPRWLEKYLVMPRYHHWHHTSQSEGINKNFAIHFPWIDRIFGTYYYPDEWPERYGLDGEEIAPSFWKQTIGPFTIKKKSTPKN
jgi:sterol desaturase/sphingolipid hydroxylase (fatty acid hydroxylase superfamily)